MTQQLGEPQGRHYGLQRSFSLLVHRWGTEPETPAAESDADTAEAAEECHVQESSIEVFSDLMSLHVRIFECQNVPRLQGLYELLGKKAAHVLNNGTGPTTPGQGRQAGGQLSTSMSFARRGFKTSVAMTRQKQLMTAVKKWSQQLAMFGRTPKFLGEEQEALHNWKNKHRYKHFLMLRDVWGDEQFVQRLDDLLCQLCPSDGLQLLRSLCVRVPRRVLGQRKLQFTNVNCPVQLAEGTLSKEIMTKPFDKKRSDKELEVLDGIVDANPLKPTRMERWFHRRRQRSTVAVYYTMLPLLFDRNTTDHTALFTCTQAIAFASDDFDQHYATPFGQAICAHCWEIAFPQFMRKRLYDVFFLLAVSMYVSPAVRSTVFHEEELRPGVVPFDVILVALAYVGIHGIFQLSIEVLRLMFNRQELKWVRRSYMTGATTWTFLVELWSAVVVVTLVIDRFTLFTPEGRSLIAMSDLRESFIGKNPGVLSGLIFAKWCQLMIYVINLRKLTDTVLPAWAAMTSPDSMAFLCYLSMITIGSSMAYYALPNHSLQRSSWHGMVIWLDCIFRMFRMDFLGDMDLLELEGVSQVVKDNVTELPGRPRPDNSIYELADGTYTSTHYVLEVGTIVCGLLFPVVLLNVYVGLLSEVYMKAKNHVRHVQGSFQTATACRLLLYEDFWRNTFKGNFVREMYDDLWQVLVKPFGSSWWSERKRPVDPESLNRASSFEYENLSNDNGVFIVIPEEHLSTESLMEGDSLRAQEEAAMNRQSGQTQSSKPPPSTPSPSENKKNELTGSMIPEVGNSQQQQEDPRTQDLLDFETDDQSDASSTVPLAPPSESAEMLGKLTSIEALLRNFGERLEKLEQQSAPGSAQAGRSSRFGRG